MIEPYRHIYDSGYDNIMMFKCHEVETKRSVKVQRVLSLKFNLKSLSSIDVASRFIKR
jgi:hypothetical protein